MHEPESPNDEFKIPLSDLYRILKKKRRKIAFGALSLGVILGSYALTRSITYDVQATFKEKSSLRSSSNTSSITSMLLSGMITGSQSEAKTLMSSRKLLQEVVKKLDLQGTLTGAGQDRGLLTNIGDNIIIETNILLNRKKNPLQDERKVLALKNVVYSGELPLSLKVIFDSEQTFEVIDSDKKKISTGRIGSAFSTREFEFTIAKVNDDTVKNKTFYLTLLPMNDLTKTLSENILITADREDSSLLKLKYQNKDRHLACAILNQLMSTYQDYLKEEQSRISSEQIAYLNKREEQMGANLKKMVDSYATKLSTEVSSVGFPNSNKALDFYTDQLQNFREKILKGDLMLKKLKCVLDEKPDRQMDVYVQQEGSNLPLINNVILEMCQLKHEADSLELAIRNSSEKVIDKWRESFQDQVAEIDAIRKCSGDACKILSMMEKGEFPSYRTDPSYEKYMLDVWLNRLQEIENQWKTSTSTTDKDKKRDEWLLFKEQFITYLSNLLHFLEVSEKSIQERISRQQAPQEEFKGINLKTANELYLTFVSDQSQLEAKLIQYKFLIDELKDPNLEISSLSDLIADPVTRTLVDNSSKTVLALQDDANRSMKEKERMKNELQIQRKFLAVHLKQTVDLLNLQLGFNNEKISALLNTTLDIIRQQISVMEKQLSDYLKTHIQNLQEERKMITEKERDLRSEMSSLPQKWADEKIIDQQLKLNATMVEEITKLVESKNISSNLERIQSAPVDKAVPSLRPQSPKVLLYSVLGAVLGTLLTSAGFIVSAILRGLPISKENLELSGLHVSGMLSKDNNANLKSIKNALTFFSAKRKDSSSLLFINGEKFHCAEEAARIMGRKGEKVLLLDGKDKTAKLGNVFNDPQTPLHIEREDFYDRLPLGCSLESACETTTSRKFQESISIFKQQYDWVVADCATEIADADAIMNLFDYNACIVSQDPLNKFSHMIQNLKNDGKINVTTFLIAEDF